MKVIQVSDKEAKGFLQTRTEIGRLHLTVVTMDVLLLLERLQKILKRDDALVFYIQREVHLLCKSL